MEQPDYLALSLPASPTTGPNFSIHSFI